MDPRQLLGRLAQIKAEGESIVQKLTASGVPQEAIMAAMQGGGQQPMQPGMGAGRGPDLPPGIPPNGGGGIQATNAAMGMGGGQRGILGPG